MITIKTILAPTDFSTHAARAVECAGELAKTLKAKLLLRQVGVDAHSVFVAGRAYQDIVRMAKELKSDLIVLGTHGRTGFSHLFFGSTAEKVVRLCPCSVLTVKHPDCGSDKELKSSEAVA